MDGEREGRTGQLGEALLGGLLGGTEERRNSGGEIFMKNVRPSDGGENSKVKTVH